MHTVLFDLSGILVVCIFVTIEISYWFGLRFLIGLDYDFLLVWIDDLRFLIFLEFLVWIGD